MQRIPPSRDSATYDWERQPRDHDQRGLFVDGPGGDSCALAKVQNDQFCAVSAPSPEGERRRRVVYKSREAAKRAALEEVPSPQAARVARMRRFLAAVKGG